MFRDWEATDYKENEGTHWGEDNLDCKGISYDCICQNSPNHISMRGVFYVYFTLMNITLGAGRHT